MTPEELQTCAAQILLLMADATTSEWGAVLAVCQKEVQWAEWAGIIAKTNSGEMQGKLNNAGFVVPVFRARRDMENELRNSGLSPVECNQVIYEVGHIVASQFSSLIIAEKASAEQRRKYSDGSMGIVNVRGP